MLHSHFSALGRITLGGLAVVALLAAPQRVDANPWNQIPTGRQPTYDYDPRAYAPAAPRNASPYGDGYGGGYAQQPRGGRIPVEPGYLQAELAQRCNVGRLVGGIVGGGLGYAVSREDGRSWAVPLGALLGQQMGCSIGAGRDPLPW
jgi:hypothetical protein